MATRIPTRILTIRDMARGYFPLSRGALIPKHDELLRVFSINSLKHEKHPHQTFRVYITRKAIKHCVEERKEQLSKKYEEAEILLKISLIIEQIPEVVTNFDKYEYEHEPCKYFYTKHYSGESSIRILCQMSKQHENAIEICSMHFTKRKKDN